MEGTYAGAASIAHAGLDALIVTGAEPLASDLRDEPYWNSFTSLTDWAKANTISTVFSCLAAHAAVLHLDSIAAPPLGAENERRVFLYSRRRQYAHVQHPAGQRGAPIRATTICPRRRSRLPVIMCCRALPMAASICSPRRCQSHFVFLQGHPEYDETSLGREYLRDIARLPECRTARPSLPCRKTISTRRPWPRFRKCGSAVRNPSLLPRFTEIVNAAIPAQGWRDDTVKLFANWLTLVASEKARRRLQSARGHSGGQATPRLKRVAFAPAMHQHKDAMRADGLARDDPQQRPQRTHRQQQRQHGGQPKRGWTAPLALDSALYSPSTCRKTESGVRATLIAMMTAYMQTTATILCAS